MCRILRRMFLWFRIVLRRLFVVGSLVVLTLGSFCICICCSLAMLVGIVGMVFGCCLGGVCMW